MGRAHIILGMKRTSLPKKAVNLTVDVKLIQQARESDINVSAVLESALRAEMARRWHAENAEAVEAYNQRLEREGLWCDEYRTW
jgi:antitoxin CcdA